MKTIQRDGKIYLQLLDGEKEISIEQVQKNVDRMQFLERFLKIQLDKKYVNAPIGRMPKGADAYAAMEVVLDELEKSIRKAGKEHWHENEVLLTRLIGHCRVEAVDPYAHGTKKFHKTSKARLKSILKRFAKEFSRQSNYKANNKNRPRSKPDDNPGDDKKSINIDAKLIARLEAALLTFTIESDRKRLTSALKGEPVQTKITLTCQTNQLGNIFNQAELSNDSKTARWICDTFKKTDGEFGYDRIYKAVSGNDKPTKGKRPKV